MFHRTIPLLLFISSLPAQEIIGEGLNGQTLLDYVIDNYKTGTTLGYNTARDILYGTIDIQENDQLSCVYSGYTITLDPDLDPSTDAYNQGINCEHTWPQSMGAGSEPQKSDMHHLYPCKTNVNSSRGNDPYAQIPDEDTDTWYRNDYSQETIPTEFIEEYAEKYNGGQQSFEPREDHKGDASRAMFYFYAMYQGAADTNFWNAQKDVLLDWHYYDLVDEWELDRTWAIAGYQEEQPNPFILDSSLARRIWYMEGGTTDTTGSDTSDHDIVVTEIMQNPSSVGDTEGEWFEIYNNTENETDLGGFIIKDNDTDSHTITGSTIVGPYSYAVLGRNSDYATNGGVTIDYEYSGVNLANGGDEILLIDPSGETVDSVAYDGGPSWPDPNGSSMALLDIALDNNVGGNWVGSDTPYGDGDNGSPGSANFTPSIATITLDPLQDYMVVHPDSCNVYTISGCDTGYYDLIIENDGYGYLSIDSVLFLQDQDLWGLLDQLPFSIGPSSTDTLHMFYFVDHFLMPDLFVSDTINVYSNDEDNDVLSIGLVHTTVIDVPAYHIPIALSEWGMPQPILDIGGSFTGDTLDTVITITSLGTEILEFDSISDIQAPFYVEATSADLELFDTLDITFRFIPDEQGDFINLATVISNAEEFYPSSQFMITAVGMICYAVYLSEAISTDCLEQTIIGNDQTCEWDLDLNGRVDVIDLLIANDILNGYDHYDCSN